MKKDLPNFSKKVIILFALFLALIIGLFLTLSTRVEAKICEGISDTQCGVECNANLQNCTCTNTDWQDVAFTACERNGKAPQYTCTGSSGATGTLCGDIGAWTFCYPVKCQAKKVKDPLSNLCEFQYKYLPQQCNAADRSEDFRTNINNKEFAVPASGGGGGTGDTQNATKGHILSGTCSASSFNGVDPKTACPSGGWYKTCCVVNAGGEQTGELAHSVNGICPAGSNPTAPGVTSCTGEAPPPPKNGGGNGGGGEYKYGNCGYDPHPNCPANACKKSGWWDGTGEPNNGNCDCFVSPTTGQTVCWFDRTKWQLGCGQGDPAKPKLTYPGNGATQVPLSLTFDWQKFKVGDQLPENPKLPSKDCNFKTDDGKGELNCWGYICAQGSFGVAGNKRFYEVQFRKKGESVWNTLVRLQGDANGDPATQFAYTIAEEGKYQWRIKAFWEVQVCGLGGCSPVQGSTFSPTWDFTAGFPSAWWQVKDADIQNYPVMLSSKIGRE